MRRIVDEKEEEKICKLNKEGKTWQEISEATGWSWKPIKKVLDKHGLKQNVKKQGIPYEFYESIFKLYESGLTLKQIHENHYPQFTTDQINYICREKGITRKSGKVANMNHDYFEKIDTPNKAYFLGLLTADGSILFNKNKGNSYSITLELDVKDKYIIEAFAKEVETDLKVRVYRRKDGFVAKGEEYRETARLMLHSVKMAEGLQALGVVRNKSNQLKVIPNINEDLYPHYIRGFFDGNGSVFINSRNQRLRVAFYSTHEYCDNLNHLLNEKYGTTLNKVYDQKDEKVSFISFSAAKDIEIIRNLFYKDENCLCLERKKKKFAA